MPQVPSPTVSVTTERLPVALPVEPTVTGTDWPHAQGSPPSTLALHSAATSADPGATAGMCSPVSLTVCGLSQVSSGLLAR